MYTENFTMHLEAKEKKTLVELFSIVCRKSRSVTDNGFFFEVVIILGDIQFSCDSNMAIALAY